MLSRIIGKTRNSFWCWVGRRVAMLNLAGTSARMIDDVWWCATMSNDFVAPINDLHIKYENFLSILLSTQKSFIHGFSREGTQQKKRSLMGFRCVKWPCCSYLLKYRSPKEELRSRYLHTTCVSPFLLCVYSLLLSFTISYHFDVILIQYSLIKSILTKRDISAKRPTTFLICLHQVLSVGPYPPMARAAYF